MSLRVCPFVQEKCGQSNAVIFSKAGQMQNTSATFYPGDVCVYVLRAECGLPSFELKGAGVDGINVDTIEYDDQEINVEISNITVDSGNFFGGTTTKGIPLPSRKINITAAVENKKNYYTPYSQNFVQQDGTEISAYNEPNSGMFYVFLSNRPNGYSE